MDEQTWLVIDAQAFAKWVQEQAGMYLDRLSPGGERKAVYGFCDHLIAVAELEHQSAREQYTLKHCEPTAADQESGR